MNLPAGTRIGSYEIVSVIGAGGMGEVYLGHDAKLNRDVAIKVLLPNVVADPDRIARFRREARVLASLNHANIAHIHGIEEADGVTALVLELVEGEDLAERLARGPIVIDEALPIAVQIAEALEAAHDLGIIHRDLKPANIKLRPDGTVKVLDFGLAKAVDPGGSTIGDAMNSPTLSLHATHAGVVLGTAAYMSPEQARGKVVDLRSDIWAFGCVLFEMLTAKRAFTSDDVTDTIVAVLSKEPDWQALPPSASSVRPLLARCLRKDRKQRLQAIGDARIQLDELIGGTSPDASATRGSGRRQRSATPLVFAALAAGMLITALLTWIVNTPPQPPPLLASRFEITPPPEQSLSPSADRDIAVSPDGRYIAYRGGANSTQLIVRAIDAIAARALSGITNARQPFFSPDSQWIGYFDGGTLKQVSGVGGAAIAIC
ncbi:MAG: serine/threonine-protein kinase, partial [Vicinamibacterales bacterium]